ncbi:hypothetical protein BV25DRAFT_1912247 [Artomyces pyxidatus]|uniref:Uncharacterized protein n=1 Tax=Artomyces pyxidatus TaxID=48021 RepID=A0ACB8TEN8_9AGAM|nr:hypothetical protein BV25DRAFT_1912247 [Artomyces pyxidatus]
MSQASAPSSQRPTLPPLHTLDLPMPSIRRGYTTLPSINEMHNDHDYQNQSSPLTSQPWQQHRNRQVSISSSTSSRLSSASPPPPYTPSYTAPHTQANSFQKSSNSPSPSPTQQQPTVRIVLCESLATADAALVCTAPGARHVSSYLQTISAPEALDKVRPGVALLVTGPALERLRHHPRPVPNGVRVHPYRIQGPVSSRRGSAAALAPKN